MENKVTIFAVFTVLAQSSLATANQTRLVTDLLTIQDAGQNAYNAFETIITGYSAILAAFVNVSCETEEYDEETLAARNNILQEQIAAAKTTFDALRDGLRPIAGNITALTANEEEMYAAAEANFRLLDTVFDLFPSKNYSETKVAIEDIEKVVIARIGDFWIQMYAFISNIVNSDDLNTNNVILTIGRTATSDIKNAFSLVFDEIQAFLLTKLSGKTKAGREACSSVMETQKNLSLILITSEVHTKFTLFQYIATANCLNDPTLIIDLNKIQAASEAVSIGFEYAFEPLFDAIIELATAKKTSSTTEALIRRVSSGFDAAFVNTLLAISYTRPEGSATITTDEAVGFAAIDMVVEGINAALESSQNTNTSEALAEIESIEEVVVVTGVKIFEGLFDAIKDAVSDIDDTLTDATESYSNKSSILIEIVIRNIFAAIKILVPQETPVCQQAGCADNIIRIETAYTAVLFNLYNELSLKFDLIRAARLYYTLKAYGITVPLSSLLYEPY